MSIFNANLYHIVTASTPLKPFDRLSLTGFFRLGLLKNENSITCKATAKSFLDDKNVVGVVGAFSSECTISMQKQFKSSGIFSYPCSFV